MSRARAPAEGIYEIYYTTSESKQAFDLDSLYGTPPKLVMRPECKKSARFTIERVSANQAYIRVNGSFLAPDDIWIRPSSTAFAWTFEDWSGAGPVIGANSQFSVWLPDKSAGWFYLVLGRRDLESRQVPIGELEMYLYPEYAGSWWFKKVA